MNYYNPYYYGINNYPNQKGIFSRFFKGNINFNNILNNTGKVLQIVNQAIPLVRQVTPVVKNAKTMFRVLSEFKKNDLSFQNNKSNVNSYKKDYYNNTNSNGPTFFA